MDPPVGSPIIRTVHEPGTEQQVDRRETLWKWFPLRSAPLAVGPDGGAACWSVCVITAATQITDAGYETIPGVLISHRRRNQHRPALISQPRCCHTRLSGVRYTGPAWGCVPELHTEGQHCVLYV